MFNQGATMNKTEWQFRYSMFDCKVKKIESWYCVYIKVRYVPGCEDLGTFFKPCKNGMCIIGEDTAKSWLNQQDFESVMIMLDAIVMGYCDLRDRDTGSDDDDFNV